MVKLDRKEDGGEDATVVDAQQDRLSISLPLYVSALIATLAALASINSVLGVDELTFTSLVLAILGFAFSFGCRWFRVPERPLNYLTLCIAGILIYRLSVGLMSITDLMPQSQNEGDLQMATILMWVAVIYSFTLVTDRKIVLSSILSISIIGLAAANDVNIDLVIYFLIYVIATIFLLIHQNYILHRTWGRASDRAPSGWRLLSTQMGLAAACGALVMLGGLVLVVPLEAVGSHLSLASAFKGLINFGHDNGNNDSSALDAGNFSDDATFAIGSGSGFSASDETVIRAYPSDHQMHYWRGRTYDQYMGSGWISSLASPQNYLVPTGSDIRGYPQQFLVPQTQADVTPSQASSTTTLETRMDMVGGGTQTLYTPAFPEAISVSPTFRARVSYGEDGEISVAPETGSFSYRVTSLDVEPTIAELQGASSGPLPANIQQMYAGRPGTMSTDDSLRLAQTAAQIVSELPATRQDEFDRAEAIRTWVSQRAEYNLNVQPVPSGQDAVSYFLFTSREGYCDLFASSMAVLCRYAGIPSRVVTGFAPGEQDERGGFKLRAKDKHAWCEVYFPNIGWYVFDPTVGVTVADNDPGGKNLSTFWPSLVNRVKAFLTLIGPIPTVLFLVVVGCVFYLIKTELIDKRKRPHKIQGVAKTSAMGDSATANEIAMAREAAGRRWDYARQALARWSVRQMPSETTLEFVARMDTVFDTICAVALSQDSRHAIPEVGKEKAALRTLAESFLLTQYSSENDPVSMLISRERDGSGDRDLASIEAFVSWGRPYARRLDLNTPTSTAHVTAQ